MKDILHEAIRMPLFGERKRDIGFNNHGIKKSWSENRFKINLDEKGVQAMQECPSSILKSIFPKDYKSFPDSESLVVCINNNMISLPTVVAAHDVIVQTLTSTGPLWVIYFWRGLAAIHWRGQGGRFQTSPDV